MAKNTKSTKAKATANTRATKTNGKKTSLPSNPNIIAIGAVGIALVAGGYGLGVANTQDIQDFSPIYTVSAKELKQAKATLESLEVRSDTMAIPDYDSSLMPGWSDPDHNGCKTRDDTLHRDMLKFKDSATKCKLKSGTMFDYYTGALIKYNRFVSGAGIDIDHIVSKGNAWISGGYSWDQSSWESYSNDPDVLIATSARANRSKGDKDASEWLPPNENFWCKYTILQVNIKQKYALSVSSDEKSAINQIFTQSCQKA